MGLKSHSPYGDLLARLSPRSSGAPANRPRQVLKPLAIRIRERRGLPLVGEGSRITRVTVGVVADGSGPTLEDFANHSGPRKDGGSEHRQVHRLEDAVLGRTLRAGIPLVCIFAMAKAAQAQPDCAGQPRSIANQAVIVLDGGGVEAQARLNINIDGSGRAYNWDNA